MTAPAETGLATMLSIIGGLGLLIGIAVYVWYAFALSRLFPRIDGEGWKGWVPVLNEAEILARGGVPAWSVVFYFIPLVQMYGLYLKVVASHRINKRFGRGAGMTVLAILLPPVWATVLAWGAAPYPEGERLAALQPDPRRVAQPATAPARDASGYTIPSLAPPNTTPADAPAPIFPDYAPPPRATDPEGAAAPVGMPAPDPSAWGPPLHPPVSLDPVSLEPVAPLDQPASPPLPSVPVEAHPPTGIMAAMGGAPAAPTADSEPEVPVDEPQRIVRSVPPSFRDGGIQDAQPQTPTIRPAPNLPIGASLDAEPDAQGGLTSDVEKTVITPRPTDDDVDATVVVARKRGVRRVLVLDDGRKFSLSGASIVIGRNPVGDPGEQRLAIADTTRTLSKIHARLVVEEDEWRLTDLHATNGVVVIADDGAEILLDPGESVIGTGRFILGEVGMHVVTERGL